MAVNSLQWLLGLLAAGPLGGAVSLILLGASAGTAQLPSIIGMGADNAAGVLGYDLLNEPLPGDFYSDLSLLLPGACARVLVCSCARACLLWPAERAAAR